MNADQNSTARELRSLGDDGKLTQATGWYALFVGDDPESLELWQEPVAFWGRRPSSDGHDNGPTGYIFDFASRKFYDPANDPDFLGFWPGDFPLPLCLQLHPQFKQFTLQGRLIRRAKRAWGHRRRRFNPNQFDWSSDS